jgi:Class II Aldolase and Adducin N-terminal domain
LRLCVGRRRQHQLLQTVAAVRAGHGALCLSGDADQRWLKSLNPLKFRSDGVDSRTPREVLLPAFIALDEDEKKRLVADLGPHRALVLRNHGFLTAGASVAEAYVLMFYLEKAARA